MKNFTNNFKQFTSRLSARWLIMALMMLVGTSSAWAANSDYYLRGGFNSWNTNNRFDANGTCTISLSANTTYEFKIAKSDWGKEFTYTTNTITATSNNLSLSTTGSNAKIKTNAAGSYVFTFSETGQTLSVTYPASCTPATSITSATLEDNGTISLAGNFTTCGAKYHGFQWRKSTADWCAENSPNENSGYVALGSADVNGSKTGSFTPEKGVTYEFRTYIVTTSPWLYSTSIEEVSTCNELPNDAYALSSISAEWTGSDITPTISKKDENYPTPTITYNEGSALPNKSGEYTIKATVNDNATYCNKEFDLGTFTITCPTIAAPAITTPDPVCAGTQVTLSNYNGDNTNTVKWYSDAACDEVVTGQVTPTDGIVYYAKAYDEASGCYSSEYSTLTFTVNPLPTISISGNNSAVLYEDVELTAATDGTSISWEITEGDGSLSSTTGNSVTLTSSSADNVTVTATATLGSCTATDTHEVEFSAENCAPVASKDIQITFTHPANNQTQGQWWGMGKMYNSSAVVLKDMGCNTSGSTTFTLTNVATSTISVYFEACYDWGYSGDNTKKATTKDSKITLYRGKKYSITITNGNIKATATATETGSLTQDPPIIAPAVKMISAEYDEENDVIVATGAVYKTGCGVTFWGFKYSEDGQTWGTEDTDFIRPDNNNSLTVPGEFHYSFPISNANGGETYYIRAYALNNYNGSYALSNAVYSATSLPVEIPSKTIESATISLVDSEGDALDVTEVCPQSTVYLKVSYVGGDFKDYEAADNFPGTNLELVNHDKANNNAIFSYTATATGVANITISNDNTSITTTNGVSITLKNVTPVNAPMISISQGTICEGGSATITVNNPIANLTYTLYKETEPIGNLVNYQTDDLTEAGSYTVRAEESICHNYANSMPVELKVVTSDVKIGLAVDKTTVNPWQPLKLTVTPPEGYAYSIDGLADVVYTQSGDVYTIKIPRPNAWSPGNSGDPVKTMPITFSAKIQVTDDLTCGTSSVNVTLADTEENCK